MSAESDNAKLLPCPFCGDKIPQLVGMSKVFAICIDKKCGAEGPERVTRADAIAAWNHRPPPPANTRGKREKAHPVFAFLLGTGPLNGHWFGDAPPREKGKRPQPYWWRSHLRAALAEDGPPTKE